MNWYEIFYWVTVADGVKGFFDVASDIFMTFAVISLIVFIGLIIFSNDSTLSETDIKSAKYWMVCFRKIWIWCMVLTTFTWMSYVFTPSKKDALIIIAGGAIGNFITNDSSSKQIPYELTLLVREKIKSEIQEIKTGVTDTLANKSKEELINIIKNK